MTHSDWRMDEFDAQPEQLVKSDASDADAEQTWSEPAVNSPNDRRARKLRRELRRAARRRMERLSGDDSAGLYQTGRTPRAAEAATYSARKRAQHEVLETVLFSAVGVAMVGFFAVGAVGGLMPPEGSAGQGVVPSVAHLESGGVSTTLAYKPTTEPQSQQTGERNSASRLSLKQIEPLAEPGEKAVSEALPIQAAALATPVGTAQAQFEDENSSATKVEPAGETADPDPIAVLPPLTTADTTAKDAGSSKPEAQADASPERAAGLVKQGHRRMSAGDVAGARVLFVQGMEFGSPEAALALGRSFDPEYLAQLPNANGQPDAARAEAMYREWHRRSLAAGTIAPGIKLSKLIQAMRRQ